MKKPILMIGILFMVIFLFQLNKKYHLFDRSKSLNASSCRSALIMLNRRSPKEWTSKCDGNNMSVEIKLTLPDKLPHKKIRQYAYRELANNMVFIAKNCLNESLDRVYFIRLKLINDLITINALTEGKYISKLATMKNGDFIKEHLQNTVQVKEELK